MTYLKHLQNAYRQTSGSIVDRFNDFYRYAVSDSQDAEAVTMAGEVTLQKLAALKIFHTFNACYVTLAFSTAVAAWITGLLYCLALSWFEWFIEA